MNETRSPNSTLVTRREATGWRVSPFGSGAGHATGVPHSLQNFAAATSGEPQVAQRASPCGAPQAKQNRAPGCCSAPHVAHATPVPRRA